MQYSIVNLLNHPVILDRREGAFINTFVKEKTMPALVEQQGKDRVKQMVYGAVLHNEACETIEHRQWLGFEFAYPQTDTYGMLSIIDIHLTPTMSSGTLTFTPFAALVETHAELNANNECVSAFLRYDDMDIITNVLNRECVYAIKEMKVLNSETECKSWKRNIDEDKMLELAFAIR